MSARTKPSPSNFSPTQLEIDFNPQGTLAERIRAGGAGWRRFSPKPGWVPLIAEGKDVREFDGERYVMERGLSPIFRSCTPTWPIPKEISRTAKLRAILIR